jgi:hypothetical protein
MQLRPFPRVLVVLVVAIAVANAFAEHYYWYWLMRWFDMPMHFAGGVWLAGMVLWWRFFSGKFVSATFTMRAVFTWAIMGAIGIGLAWEVYEVCVSYLTVGHMNDIGDTISDLIFDAFGGLTAAGMVWLKQKHN